jgi:PBP1b-binding outer membrane lipoprotein LpoB
MHRVVVVILGLLLLLTGCSGQPAGSTLAAETNTVQPERESPIVNTTTDTLVC